MIESNINICFTSSSGGHFEQMTMLYPIMTKYNSFILTERTQYGSEIKGKKTYYLRQVNRREKIFLLSMIHNLFKSIVVFVKERPDVVISTGVLATIPICLIAKLFHKKLIYIESFAKITSPTETGKLMYKIADQFYIQWEPMRQFYPDAIYLGGIY